MYVNKTRFRRFFFARMQAFLFSTVVAAAADGWQLILYVENRIATDEVIEPKDSNETVDELSQQSSQRRGRKSSLCCFWLGCTLLI